MGESGRSWPALVATIVAFASPASVEAALPEWEFITPFEIHENAGAALAGVQVELSVDTQTLISAGELEADGADMRFAYDCAGDELVDYWIDATTMNTGDTRVWVAVDLAANETLLLRMFHGNAAATPVSDLEEVFDGPYSATQQITGGTSGGVANSQRGIRFTPQRDVLVTEFGKNEPNGTQRSVILWNTAAGTILHQESVAGAASMYSYAPIDDPIWLASGSDYIVSIFQGASDSYFWQQSSQISPHLTYVEMRYCNDCAVNTFPSAALAGYHYGYPDFNYWIKQEVSPAPTSVEVDACTEDATCDDDCSVAECGDGVTNISAGEECDDGGVVDGDGCSSSCLDEGSATSTSGGTTDTSGATSDAMTSTSSASEGGSNPSDPSEGGSGDGADDDGPTGDGTADDDGGETSSNNPTAGLPFEPTDGLDRSGCACRSTPSGAAPLLLLLFAWRRRRVSARARTTPRTSAAASTLR